SPWGKGRPGWHLECSILSSKYLGKSIDMHLGGVDLIFPHHTNEIAQSEGADESGKPFVKYWVHGAHLIVDGKKMSKSAGNYFTMDDLTKENPDTVRMYFLNTHYRDVLNFTFDSLKQVDSQRERIQKLLDDLHSELTKKNLFSTTVYNEFDHVLHEELTSIKEEIIEALNNDLSTPLVMKKLNNIVRSVNSYLQKNENNINHSSLIFAYTTLRELLDVFGLFPEKSGGYDPEFVEKLMQSIIDLRNSLRKEKQWEISDKIRDMLKSIGVELKDLKDGTRWRKID
ncbi:MAG: DALR domain-containing protein, partial [Candidatus Kariarchaeaceae archaeon]